MKRNSLDNAWNNWSQQTFVLMKTSWRRLEDVLIKTSIFPLALLLQKTSSRRLQDVLDKPIYSSWLYVFKMSSRRFQDVFKTSCKNVFKTSSTEEYALVTLLLITLWSVYKSCKTDKNFSSFSFSVYYTFSGCI